jgi:hypothetical protein
MEAEGAGRRRRARGDVETRAAERVRVVGPVGDDIGGGVKLGGLSFMEAEGTGRRCGARGGEVETMVCQVGREGEVHVEYVVGL